jgi:hypothetical protein
VDKLPLVGCWQRAIITMKMMLPCIMVSNTFNNLTLSVRLMVTFLMPDMVPIFLKNWTGTRVQTHNLYTGYQDWIALCDLSSPINWDWIGD